MATCSSCRSASRGGLQRQEGERKALFGVFDVTDEAKKLNNAGQKVYPSIEIEPNFAGKGFAYLMGCALTDSPASIATQRLQFNRALPGTLTVAGDKAAALEFADETGDDAGTGFLAGLSGVLDRFAAKFSPAPPKQDPVPPDDPAQVPPSISAKCARWSKSSPAEWPRSSPACAANSAPRPTRWQSSSRSSRTTQDRRRTTTIARGAAPTVARQIMPASSKSSTARPASRHHRT
jgi:hypothetical protein